MNQANVWITLMSESAAQPWRLKVRGRSMWPTLRPGDEAVIQPVAVSELQLGDWVVVCDDRAGFLHRYLGEREGKLLTKGDHNRSFDPLWPPSALLGRVIEAHREGQCFYRRTLGRARYQQMVAWGHKMMGNMWQIARKIKGWLALVLLLMLVLVPTVRAAVTVTGFVLEWGAEEIYLFWETASETDNLGFYVARRQGNTGEYARISGFIGSQDEGAGAFYEYVDDDVTLGVTYYYRLEDVPSDGSAGEYFFPSPPSIAIPDGEDATPTATPTPTPTSTPASSEDAPPAPDVRFWAEETNLSAGNCTTVRWDAQGVQSLYLNGVGVTGVGARTYCPCDTETHTLAATYPDGSTEDFRVTLTVTGQCTDEQRVATATPTPTERADPESAPSTPATASTSTPTPFPTRAGEDGGPSSPPTSTVTPPSPDSTSTPEPTRSPADDGDPGSAAPSATPTRASVLGDDPAPPSRTGGRLWMTGLLLFAGLLIGAGLIGGGIWFWKQQA